MNIARDKEEAVNGAIVNTAEVKEAAVNGAIMNTAEEKEKAVNGAIVNTAEVKEAAVNAVIQGWQAYDARRKEMKEEELRVGARMRSPKEMKEEELRVGARMHSPAYMGDAELAGTFPMKSLGQIEDFLKNYQVENLLVLFGGSTRAASLSGNRLTTYSRRYGEYDDNRLLRMQEEQARALFEHMKMTVEYINNDCDTIFDGTDPDKEYRPEYIFDWPSYIERHDRKISCFEQSSIISPMTLHIELMELAKDILARRCQAYAMHICALVRTDNGRGHKLLSFGFAQSSKKYVRPLSDMMWEELAQEWEAYGRRPDFFDFRIEFKTPSLAFKDWAYGASWNKFRPWRAFDDEEDLARKEKERKDRERAEKEARAVPVKDRFSRMWERIFASR